MRCLEVILTLACAGYFVRLATFPRLPAPWPLVLSLLLVALLVTQLVIEGWRLPMLPVYAVVLAAVAEAVMPGTRTPGMLLVVTAGAIAILAASTVGALLFQRLNIAQPTGPLPVGVATLPSVPRIPGAGGTEDLPAPIKIVWYPAVAPSRGQQLSAFFADRFANGLKATDQVPATPDLAPADAAATGAARGPAAPANVAAIGTAYAATNDAARGPAAPATGPSAGKYPVLVYFGGWPEGGVQNRSLICELVSRGFVVVSLQYPQTGVVDRPMAFYDSDAAFQHSVDLTDERAKIYARDASDTLDELRESRTFNGIVDLQRAGIFGYSFGGAVAAQATHLDPRFKAAVNIDGRHYANGRMEGVQTPYMFVGEVLLMPTEDMLKSTDAPTRYEARADLVDYTLLAKNLRRNGGIQVIIDGTTHPNFSDDVMRSPLGRLSGGGKIDPARALQINNSLVVNFFETELLGRATAWLTDIPRNYPETQIQRWTNTGTVTETQGLR